MMTYDAAVTGVSFFVAVLLLPIALYLWRMALLSYAQEVSINIKHKLFVQASKNGALDDPGFLEVYGVLDVFSAWAKHATGLRLLFFIIQSKIEKVESPSFNQKKFEGSPIESDLKVAIKRFSRLTRLHIMLSSLSGLAVMLVLHFFAYVRHKGVSYVLRIIQLGIEGEQRDNCNNNDKRWGSMGGRQPGIA